MIIYKVELYDSQGVVEVRAGIIGLSKLYSAMRSAMNTAEDSPNLHVLRLYVGDELTCAWAQKSDRRWVSTLDTTLPVDK